MILRFSKMRSLLGGESMGASVINAGPIVTPPIPVTSIYPSGFRWVPPVLPFEISESAGVYSSTFDAADFDFSSTVGVTYYFNNVTGNDANSGLTPLLPKKTIHLVMTALNAAPPVGGAAFILQTDYEDIYGASTVNIAFDLVMKSDVTGTRRRFSKIVNDGITVTLVSGNVYNFNRPGAGGASMVLDYSNVDGDGFPVRLFQVYSVAACQALPNSFYKVDQFNVNVHLFDSRVPNSSVKVLRSGPAFFSTSNLLRRLYCEDIEFFSGFSPTFTNGGGLSIGRNSNLVNQFCLKNCVGGYGFYGLQFWCGNSTTDNKTRIYLQDCWSVYASGDGFNYHNYLGSTGSAEWAPYVYEQGCVGKNNGYVTDTTTIPNCNGSTIHDSGTVIRINGIYQQNENRNVHDINSGTQVWMLGCDVGQAKNVANPDDSVDYDCGGHVGPETTTMWLDGCVFTPGSLVNLKINPGASVFTRNIDLTGWSVANAGTLGTY